MKRIPKELTTVTPFSKATATVTFFALIVISFIIGMKYQEMISYEDFLLKEKNVQLIVPQVVVQPTNLTPSPSPKISPSIIQSPSPKVTPTAKGPKK